jgi:hypothetical protein
MISEIQVHVIARQMFEKHGLKAIAQAAQNAQACVAPHRRRYEDDAGTASKLTGLQRSIKQHERAITLRCVRRRGVRKCPH